MLIKEILSKHIYHIIGIFASQRSEGLKVNVPKYSFGLGPISVQDAHFFYARSHFSALKILK